MPRYSYKAKKGPNTIVTGDVEADSPEKASGKVIEMGLFPVSITQKADEGMENMPAGRAAGGQEAKAAPHVKARAKDIDIFTHQLSSLVRSGVPMLRALVLISEQTENRVIKGVVCSLEENVKDGKMLSDAMRSYPYIFDNLYLNVVKAGERSGTLDVVLDTLAKYREREQEMRQKIQAAMIYPLLLLTVGFGCIFIILTCFMPKLTKLFLNMKQTLPLPTRILMALSSFMAGSWFYILIVLVLMIAVAGKIKPGAKKKLLFDALVLHVPYINKFIRNSEIAKFSKTLSLLLKNGISVTEGLSLAADTLNNEALRDSFLKACSDIVGQGRTLSASLKKAGVFPAFPLNMIAVGEESGKLTESLDEVASVYENEVEQATKIMTALIEPLLILVIGGVVGFIVFAMLMPIFNMGTTGL